MNAVSHVVAFPFNFTGGTWGLKRRHQYLQLQTQFLFFQRLDATEFCNCHFESVYFKNNNINKYAEKCFGAFLPIYIFLGCLCRGNAQTLLKLQWMHNCGWSFDVQKIGCLIFVGDEKSGDYRVSLFWVSFLPQAARDCSSVLFAQAFMTFAFVVCCAMRCNTHAFIRGDSFVYHSYLLMPSIRVSPKKSLINDFFSST